MVEEIPCSAESFLKAANRILERFPLVNVLSLYDIQGRGMRFASQPELSAMRSLKMAHLADDDWQSIVRSPYLGRVERLRVAFPRPIDLAWLLDTPLARQLYVLDLTGSRLDANLLINPAPGPIRSNARWSWRSNLAPSLPTACASRSCAVWSRSPPRWTVLRKGLFQRSNFCVPSIRATSRDRPRESQVRRIA